MRLRRAVDDVSEEVRECGRRVRGGQVDPGSDAHDLCHGDVRGCPEETQRIKMRMRTAMAAQASLDGPYLGGRSPIHPAGGCIRKIDI
jgi:hypothetical protein